MKPFRQVTVVAFLFALLAVAPVAASDYTVGQFVQQLAERKQLDADSPRVAALSLYAIGTPIPTKLDFSKRLTEGDLVEISRALGLGLTTSTPDAPFDRTQVERFFGAFGIELGFVDKAWVPDPEDNSYAAAGKGPPFDPFTKAKGKGKQIVTEIEP